MVEKKINEASNNIKVIFDSENNFVLTSNNPDLDRLISVVVDIKDKCDFSKLKIETDNKEFDKDGFEVILKSSISSFLSDIKINKENLQKAINSIKDDKYNKGEEENEK